MSITTRGIGTKENPAVGSFAIKNKRTGAITYRGGTGVTFYHPDAKSVNFSTTDGVTEAIRNRQRVTGSGVSTHGGRNRVWTSFDPLPSFHFFNKPGTLTIIVETKDGRKLTATAHLRPPTHEEMTAGVAPLNKNLVELASREDEAKAWDKNNKDVPEPEEDAETYLLAIEDSVEKLRERL